MSDKKVVTYAVKIEGLCEQTVRAEKWNCAPVTGDIVFVLGEERVAVFHPGGHAWFVQHVPSVVIMKDERAS